MLNRVKFIRSGLLAILILVISHGVGAGQSLKILAGSAFNGAVTGSMLGGATMAIQDDLNWNNVEFGVGGGIIGGVGLGIYDVTRIQTGNSYYISGTFNDGESTSVIVLLDTFYGAATGALIGSAVMLMKDQYIVDGLQYGSGIGAWAGFGYGLIDGLLVSNLNSGGYGGGYSSDASGMINMQYSTDHAGEWNVGLLSPGLISQPDISKGSLGTKSNLTLDVLNFKITI